MIDTKSSVLMKKTKKQLQELHKMKTSFAAQQEQKLANIEDQFQVSMLSLDSQIKRRLAKLDELQKAVTVEFSPERLRNEMRELNEFKTQFIDAIKQNAERFNAGIRRLNQQSQRIEKQFALRVEKIDRKIAELDTFERNFAKEIGIAFEKMTKKKE